MKTLPPDDISTSSKRYLILDSLRGIALLGICLANFPEFSLYTFQKQEVIIAMPSAGFDHIIRYLQFIFIDGKFYSIFSLLFGIGFSIQIEKIGKQKNTTQKNQRGIQAFYRRLAILAFFGLLHLMFLWSGDILLLYALIGLLLPFFRYYSNKTLLTLSALLIFCPVMMDTIKALSGNYFDLAAPLTSIIQYFHQKNGITDNNFGVWLVMGQNYTDVLQFTLSGAFIRIQELLASNRVFKVLGLFLFGLYVGRNRIYADLEKHKPLLQKIRMLGFIVGLPLSFIYGWNAMNNQPLGIIGSSIIYATSVVPLSLAYLSTLCLWFMNNNLPILFKFVATPGRMALTNYIGQSVLGIIIFYGVGFGLGAVMGLIYVELIALAIFAFQLIFSCIWLHYFQFGPLEWLWRMMTYKTLLKLTK